MRSPRCHQRGSIRPWIAVAMGLALAWPSVVAAWVPRELRGRRVSAVEIVGQAARQTTPRDVGIPLGAPLSRALLRSAVQRLVRSGRWADVQLRLRADGRGVRILARLVPRLVLQRVDIVGNGVLDDAEIRRELRIGTETEIERDHLPALEETLRAMYRTRGYERLSAELLLRDTDDPARKVLRIEIDEGVPTRIHRIVFRGDEPPLRQGVRRAMDIEEGDILDRERVAVAARAGEQRLRDRGWLEARLRPPVLQRSDAGVIVEVPTLLGPHYDVRILGFEPLALDMVRSEMRLGEERLRSATLRTIQDRVVDLYRRFGFHDAEVRVRVLEGETDSDAVMEVSVVPGSQLQVLARAYPGARHFEQAFLEDQFEAFLQERIGQDSPIAPVDSETARRLFESPHARHRRSTRPVEVDPTRVYYEPAYAAAAEHVQELYQADGFLDARVGPVALERLEPGRALVVLPVREGPRTLLHDVSIEGNEALGERALLLASGLAGEMPFSYLALERAEDAIRDAYQERGYFYVDVRSDVRFSGDRTRAEILLSITERYPVYISDVFVEGAERTRVGLILHVADLEGEDLLTPQALRGAQDRLMDLGVFAGVNVQPQDPELTARAKPVTITVSERLPQHLDFRLGFSTAQGARFGFEYGVRNVAGTALTLNLRGQVAYQFIFLDDIVRRRFESLPLGKRLEWRVSPSVTLPYIGLRDVRVTLGASFQHENERNFSLDRFNFVNLTFTWRPLRPLTVVFAGNFEGNDIELFEGEDYDELLAGTTDVRLRNLIRVPEGRTTVVAAETTLSLDLRDNPFTPRRGFFASGNLEWAKTLFSEELLVGGQPERFESNHLRVRLTASGYIPIGKEFVFATQLQIGRVIHLTNRSETYPNRQFFLGGVDSLRGYLEDALIPQDLADEIREDPELQRAAFVGGDVFLVVRGELRFPIYSSLRGGAFLDLGNAWSDPTNFNPIRLRPTAGLGLRISTPVGPIALDYGFLLKRRRYLSERLGAFHFSISLF